MCRPMQPLARGSSAVPQLPPPPLVRAPPLHPHFYSRLTPNCRGGQVGRPLCCAAQHEEVVCGWGGAATGTAAMLVVVSGNCMFIMALLSRACA